MKVKERKKERKGKSLDHLLHNAACVVISRLGSNPNTSTGTCHLPLKEQC